MYVPTHLSDEEIISGLRGKNTQLKVIQDLLNVNVKCEDMSVQLDECYYFIREHLPEFVSLTVKQAFILGVIKIEQRCNIDLFNFITKLFIWFGPSTKEFQNALLSYPKYLPFIYIHEPLYVSQKVANQTIQEFIYIERNRDNISFDKYEYLLRLLSLSTLNYPHQDDGSRDDESSNFIKYVLTHRRNERQEIIQEHLSKYKLLLIARKEYLQILEAINILNEEEYEDDGWMPLPNMVLDRFMAEDTRLNILRHEME